MKLVPLGDRVVLKQVEVAVKGNGGPNPHPLKRVGWRCSFME